MSYLNRVAFSLAIILYLNKVAFSTLFRIYTHDDLFARLYIPTPGIGPIRPLNEIQVSLAFARDYDENDHHTNGLFTPYWDERTVTPQLISEFKKNYTKRHVKAKVFASIGDRDPRYPFQIKDGDTDAWVSNAAESLTAIVKKYHLDGIDVYYEHITAKEDEFVYAIGELIAKLKKERAITVASIAPSAALNDNFYVPLYKKFGKSIDTVVYQCHKEVEPVLEPRTLVERFQTEATEKYSRDKLLAGYSAIYKDWDTLLPIVYFLGGLEILMPLNLHPLKVYSAVGTSIWFVAPESPFSPDWCTVAALACAANAPHVTAS